MLVSKDCHRKNREFQKFSADVCVFVLELPEEEVNQGKLLMYNRAELKTSDHRCALRLCS